MDAGEAADNYSLHISLYNYSLYIIQRAWHRILSTVCGPTVSGSCNLLISLSTRPEANGEWGPSQLRRPSCLAQHLGHRVNIC